MSSNTLTADNGVISGTSGIKYNGGNDGTLQLQTTTAGGTATTALTIDNSQNVGIGVTPSTWVTATGRKSIEIGAIGNALFGAGSSDISLFSNSYINTSSQFTYANTGPAARYQIPDGSHRWYIAPSGTAGNAITFTQAMTLDASGNLGLGATTLSDKLTVGDGTISTDAVVRINGGSNTGKGSGIRLMKAGEAYGYIGAQSWLLGTGTSSNLVLSTTGNPDVAIDSSAVLYFNSGYGSSAKAYGCRAWVNFNGTGTPAIRASGNVTSITDNGTADFTVNFTTAMPDANYAVSGAAGRGTVAGNETILTPRTDGYATSSIRFFTTTGSGTATDPLFVNVAIHR